MNPHDRRQQTTANTNSGSMRSDIKSRMDSSRDAYRPCSSRTWYNGAFTPEHARRDWQTGWWKSSFCAWCKAAAQSHCHGRIMRTLRFRSVRSS